MSEHDAATVARATLWLDTSNETNTRPAQRLDDCETIAFEAPSACPPTTVLHVAAQDATDVIDRNRAFAAFASESTGELAVHIPRPRFMPSGVLAKRAATHLAAFALGAALTLLFGPKRASTALLTAPPSAQAKVTAAPQPIPNAKPPEPKLMPSNPEANGGTPPAITDAVDALARGDYAVARRMYAQLASTRPNDAPVAAVASILASRARAACEQAGKDASCER